MKYESLPKRKVVLLMDSYREIRPIDNATIDKIRKILKFL